MLMAYYEANEPYTRVDNDYIGNNMMLAGGGALAGAGLTDMALRGFGKTKVKSVNVDGQEMSNRKFEKFRQAELDAGRTFHDRELKANTKPTVASKVRGSMFGKSRWGRVGSYLAYGAAGSALGAA